MMNVRFFDDEEDPEWFIIGDQRSRIDVYEEEETFDRGCNTFGITIEVVWDLHDPSNWARSQVLLEVEPRMTIRNVNDMVRRKMLKGTSLEDQYIILLCDGLFLYDHKTLADYNVNDRSKMRALLVNACQYDSDPSIELLDSESLTFQDNSGEVDQERDEFDMFHAATTSALDVPEPDNLGEMGQESDSGQEIDGATVSTMEVNNLGDIRQGVDDDQIEIEVTGCGWSGLLQVRRNMTVYDFKNRIKEAAELEPEKQVIVHGDGSTGLEDGETLASYNLKDKSLLWILGSPLKLHIRMPQAGETMLLNGYGIKSVGDIKRKIHEKMGIPCTVQNLIYKGNLLADSETLESLKFENDSVVHAIFKNDGYLIDEGEEFLDFMSQNKATALEYKTLIESVHDVPICLLEVFSKGKKLKDWEYTAGCSNSDEVGIRGHPIKLFVQVGEQNNDLLVMEADNSDLVENIMDMIPEEEMEKNEGRPCLFFDNVLLEAEKSLADYGIESGARLSLDRLVQIHVTKPNGVLTTVNLKLSSPLSTVKETIAEECGIPYQLQQLKYNDDELHDDSMTLAQCEDVLGSLWALRWNFGDGTWSFFWPSYAVSQAVSRNQ